MLQSAAQCIMRLVWVDPLTFWSCFFLLGQRSTCWTTKEAPHSCLRARPIISLQHVSLSTMVPTLDRKTFMASRMNFLCWSHSSQLETNNIIIDIVLRYFFFFYLSNLAFSLFSCVLYILSSFLWTILNSLLSLSFIRI